MKFVYVDESGQSEHSDVFVMCGLVVDAYNLRKKTEEFEQLLTPILKIHPGKARDFKTGKFIQGDGGWKDIKEDERQDFLREVCKLAVSKGGKIVGIALSFPSLQEAIRESAPPIAKPRYWQVSAMFIASLVQKKMQVMKKGKGLTVFIMDEHQGEMPWFSDELHKKNEWFDGLYVRKNGQKQNWKPRRQEDRFDQIINTAFAIKSEHATLIQVADVICHVYRRHLEITSTGGKRDEEQQFYAGLFQLLENHRYNLGRCPTDRPCVSFYEKAKHRNWKL